MSYRIRRGYRRHLRGFLRPGRSDGPPGDIEGPVDAAGTRPRGHCRAGRARQPVRHPAAGHRLFHPRHDRRHQFGDPAQGHSPLPVHHRELRRRAGSGAPQDARPVSPDVAAGRAADHARSRAAGAPAHPGRRHRGDAARSCEPAPRARPGDRTRRRGHRAGAAPLLSQPGARTRGRAPDRPMGAGPAGVLLERRLADHPRIRAHRHGHHPWLRAAARGALPDRPAGRPETGRRRQPKPW